MPITINSNIAALQVHGRLARTTREIDRAFEHLSSGLRITRARDDAAGLAIADTLRADVRVVNQGVRNVNYGLSLLAIADGAIEELSNIVIRIRKLAEQAATGSLGDKQRVALDKEAQALTDEYIRIVRTTSFNDLNILSRDVPSLRV